MTGRILAVAVLTVGLPALLPQPEPLFNPVGKWTVSTTSDTGQAVKVSVTIAGRLGAYTGSAISPEGNTLPLRDLATTPTGMIALFDLPQGAIVVRMVRDAAGKFTGAWAETSVATPLTATKDGGTR
jgi:hypothetical protein